MPEEVQTAQIAEPKVSDKEFNFRQLEAKYRTELEKEKQARFEIERRIEQLQQQQTGKVQEEEDETDPYVDFKKLDKKLAKFGQSTQTDINKAMEKAKIDAKEELKQELWLENNPDFIEVLQHAEKFAQSNPMLAETILKMPDTFERKKLVYANIKAMNLHRTPSKEPTAQEKIDSNRKNLYYQPSGVAAAPFQPQGDFSEAGKKAAYQKMQESKARLRIS
jgi:hypothetical protein